MGEKQETHKVSCPVCWKLFEAETERAVYKMVDDHIRRMHPDIGGK